MPKYHVTVEIAMRRTIEGSSLDQALNTAWQLADDFLDESMCTWDAEVTGARGYEAWPPRDEGAVPPDVAMTTDPAPAHVDLPDRRVAQPRRDAQSESPGEGGDQ